jgi:two-component system, LytTR family, response regulator
MTISCIVIEDEPLAMERAKEFVLKVPFLNLLRTFDNGLEAIDYLTGNQVDLVFLDIQMDGFSGIQFLESLDQRPEVIVTTAFDNFAIKGFELKVIDYLLKPYTLERFMQAVVRVHDKLKPNLSKDLKNYIFIKTEYRLEKILLSDILFIEGMRDYRRIHTLVHKIMTLQTFKYLEEILPAQNFCRVHKSFLVAIDKIESIERERIKIFKHYIPISDTYRDQFYSLIRYSKK